MSQASDPSAITIDIIRREIAHLSDRIDLKIEGIVSAFTARIDAIDRATQVFQDNLVRVPTETQRAIAGEHAVTQEMLAKTDIKFEKVVTQITDMGLIVEEKFRNVCNQLDAMEQLKSEQFESIQQQFAERDVRSEAAAAASKIAVDAALTAQKEAVAEQARSAAAATEKSERSQVKAIEQQGELIATSSAAKDSQIADIKERLTRIEAGMLGQAGARHEQQTASTATIGLIGLIVVVLSTVIGLALRFVGR